MSTTLRHKPRFGPLEMSTNSSSLIQTSHPQFYSGVLPSLHAEDQPNMSTMVSPSQSTHHQPRFGRTHAEDQPNMSTMVSPSQSTHHQPRFGRTHAEDQPKMSTMVSLSQNTHHQPRSESLHAEDQPNMSRTVPPFQITHYQPRFEPLDMSIIAGPPQFQTSYQKPRFRPLDMSTIVEAPRSIETSHPQFCFGVLPSLYAEDQPSMSTTVSHSDSQSLGQKPRFGVLPSLHAEDQPSMSTTAEAPRPIQTSHSQLRPKFLPSPHSHSLCFAEVRHDTSTVRMAKDKVDETSSSRKAPEPTLYRGSSLGDFTVPHLYALSVGSLSDPVTDVFSYAATVGSFTGKSTKSFDPTAEEPETIGDLRRLLQYLRVNGLLPTENAFSDNKAHARNDSSFSVPSGSSPPTSVTEDTYDAARYWQDWLKPDSHADASESEEIATFSIEEFRTLCALLASENKQLVISHAHDPLPNENTELVLYENHSRPQTPESFDSSLSDLGKYPLAHQRDPIRPWQRRLEINQQYEGLTSASQQSVPPRSKQMAKQNSKPRKQPLTYPYTVENAEERMENLTKKLITMFRDAEEKIMEAARNGGIHIFVDFSNINIGFRDIIKANRGFRPHETIAQPPISFEALDMIFARGRLVARRVLVGSTRSDLDEYKVDKTFMNAKKQGYEVNVLERVRKQKAKVDKRSAQAVTAGYSSASDGPASGKFLDTEQGVDEILHLKILESIIDTEEASTMVVASGDAAPAEYSGGFLKMIERALLRGWKIEIVSWKENLNRQYRGGHLERKHAPRFKVILLDDFAEELIDI